MIAVCSESSDYLFSIDERLGTFDWCITRKGQSQPLESERGALLGRRHNHLDHVILLRYESWGKSPLSENR